MSNRASNPTSLPLWSQGQVEQLPDRFTCCRITSTKGQAEVWTPGTPNGPHIRPLHTAQGKDGRSYQVWYIPWHKVPGSKGDKRRAGAHRPTTYLLVKVLDDTHAHVLDRRQEGHFWKAARHELMSRADALALG